MLPWQVHLTHQLEELHLIQCSLLPDERLAFVLRPEDLTIWTSLLDAFTDASGFGNDDGVVASLTEPPCQARFEVRVVGVQTWFEVALPRCTDVLVTDTNTDAGYAPSYGATSITISVKGEHVSRDAHERWNAEIGARMAEMDEGCTFPAYELLNHLIATLHSSQVPPSSSAALSLVTATTTSPPVSACTTAPEPLYHTLLTSHHLVSTTKRRTMHHLSTQLGISGFAKVGYPGIIYAEGPREAVDAFVREVKGMQWLALRVRFVEPIPDSRVGSDVVATREQSIQWVEVTKVGEVLALMRMREREALVTNLGIGAPSKESRS